MASMRHEPSLLCHRPSGAPLFMGPGSGGSLVTPGYAPSARSGLVMRMTDGSLCRSARPRENLS